MGYPFDENPLDEYLGQLFSLRVEELDSSYLLEEKETVGDKRLMVTQNLNAIREKIIALRAEYGFKLKPRSHDVFRSGPELAIERFKREYPAPPETGPCTHAREQITKRVYRDGTLHVVSQCLDCGRAMRPQSKSKFSLDSLPDFDENLSQAINGYSWWWNAEKYRIFSMANSIGSDIPSFDYAAFDAKFIKFNPKPVWVDCQHTRRAVRLRTYKSGHSAIVQQCTDCGKHIADIKKSLVPLWSDLPAFDEELEPAAIAIANQWYQRRSEASEHARKEYRKDVAIRIASGEIAIQDNSKFGTYYQSEQWANTRARILRRDDDTCQACKAMAECVHHIVYDRLGEENDLDLISLCHACHEKIHLEQRKLHNLYRMPPWEIRYLHKDRG